MLQPMYWVVLLVNVFLGSAARAQDIAYRDDLLPIFEREGVTGAFVAFEPASKQVTVVNAAFAQERRFPASTFKIANSLIALEVGAVADVDEIIPYGGGKTAVAAWAHDMSMRDAIVVSNVPIYQELARRVGREDYQDWLAKLAYGNAETGTDVENFWLKGPLRISPLEQTDFLARLAAGQLPLSQRSQTMVREILKVDTRRGQSLFAKSGWTIAPDPDIGWYVGWVEAEGRLHSFALVLEIRRNEHAAKRQDLALKFLQALQMY